MVDISELELKGNSACLLSSQATEEEGQPRMENTLNLGNFSQRKMQN